MAAFSKRADPGMQTGIDRTDPACIHDTLRERICLLVYPPGSVLREADIATEFGVSRTPVRGALQRLAQAGLIVSRDGVGTIVTEPEFDELRDIYLMRLEIAALIGRMRPEPLGPDHLTAADLLAGRAAAIVERFDSTEYWRINHDLHFLISRIIGNLALRGIWDELYFQAARMWYRHARTDPAGVAEDLAAEIGETCRAIALDDPVALGFVQRNHIAYGLKRLEEKYGVARSSRPGS
jgi:DNA-binding GntR family transcriptional regulator